MIGWRRTVLACGALGCAVLMVLSGCAPSVPPPPPPEVTVSLPVKRDIVDYAEFTGTTEGFESVEIRARVKGFLESIRFEAGQMVEEGELLFVIDPKPFQARVDQAEADLASKKAHFERNQTELRRTEELVAQDAATDRELVTARTARDSSQAAVDAAQAALDEARLDLGYTSVVSPIEGRVSRNLVDVGNLVGDTEATLLTTVVKHDPVYVYFDVSEKVVLDVLAWRREHTEPTDKPKVYLGLANEEGYPHEGFIDFLDNRVDTATGTAIVRGVFENPEGFLYPGLFVRVRIPTQPQKDALLVKETALGTDLGGKYLLVVDDQNVVAQRHVELGSLIDGMRVIRKGLAADERYVVKGLQRARPGLPVTPIDEPAVEQQKPPAEETGSPTE